jgi:hypothetical protein
MPAYRCRRARFLTVLAAVCGASLAWAHPGLALTHVSATTYTANTTWTAAASPYVLDGDVTVASGATLTVQAGAIVKFNGQFRTLTVNGTLSAVGSASNRITFTSLEDDSAGGDSGADGPTVGAAGQWYSISLGGGGILSAFSDVDVRFGGYGSTNWGYGEVRVSGSGTYVSVDHSSFTYSGSSGVQIGIGGA